MASKLSSRFTAYPGLNHKSRLGPRVQGLGYEAISGHSAWATSIVDFGAESFVNATGAVSSPSYLTCTASGGANAHTVACNSSNGYLLITAGDADITGWNVQRHVANVPQMNGIAWTHTTTTMEANTDIATLYQTDGRKLFWSARIALSCTVPWTALAGGSAVFGMGLVDSAWITMATGVADAVTSSIGFFHIANNGDITVENRAADVTTSSPILPISATTLAHTSSAFRARDFHDYSIYMTEGALGSTTSRLEYYFDGKFLGTTTYTQAAHANNIWWVPTFELINGTGGDCTMAVASMVVAQPRYHAIHASEWL